MKEFEIKAGEAIDFIFKSALAFMEGKVVLDYEKYKVLKAKYKALAFSVSGYTQIEILNAFRDELLKAIKNGTTKAAFKKQMDSFLKDKGYTGITAYKASVVFQTNMQTAFNVGHYNSMMDVIGDRPYWRYMTAGDNRVREEHQAMDGQVFPANDPVWDTWYPPNGYRCRCIVVSESAQDLINKGLNEADGLPYDIDRETGEINEMQPDKGFRCNPAKVKYSPDVNGLPDSLKKAYESREKEKKT